MKRVYKVFCGAFSLINLRNSAFKRELCKASRIQPDHWAMHQLVTGNCRRSHGKLSEKPSFSVQLLKYKSSRLSIATAAMGNVLACLVSW